MAETDIPREAERILLALDEQTRLETRPLVEKADLKSTQSAHHYWDSYLRERGLVKKHTPEPGKQAEWEITEEGETFVDLCRDEIAIPATPEEAADVATKAKQKAKAAKKTASTLTGKFEQHKSDVDERIEDIKDDVSELNGKFVNEKIIADAVLEDLEEDINRLERSLENVVESAEERFEYVSNRRRQLLDRKAHDTDLIRAELRIRDLEEENENLRSRLERMEAAVETIDEYVEEDLFQESQ